MSAPWTAADFRRDASDLTAEATDAAMNELYADRDAWPDDDRPTRVEVDADERDYGFDWEREESRRWGNER